ncbi:MAG: isoprenylcysteine carboxylmethyltransferase family protein [Acidobacteria bacterium]|nr:isoprenylcysteine carboxylmethyltransferase family protein [Acidobacteriota bacterium]
MRQWLTRFRVGMGFALAGLVLLLAQPTWMSWQIGLAVALAGEALRVWAAGHLEKSREVTTSGPYRYTRHPLYLGSTLIGIGLAIASFHWGVALIVLGYLATTLTAARRSEEAHLREKFGDAYDAYAERRAVPMARRFSWTRARYNREHHTMAGLAAGFAVLAFIIR